MQFEIDLGRNYFYFFKGAGLGALEAIGKHTFHRILNLFMPKSPEFGYYLSDILPDTLSKLTAICQVRNYTLLSNSNISHDDA